MKNKYFWKKQSIQLRKEKSQRENVWLIFRFILLKGTFSDYYIIILPHTLILFLFSCSHFLFDPRFSYFIVSFHFLLFFEVDKSRAFAPTYPPLERKSDLRSCFVCVNQVILFYLKDNHFKALDLKNDPFYLVRNWNDKLSKPYFWGRAWLGELILALVSL